MSGIDGNIGNLHIAAGQEGVWHQAALCAQNAKFVTLEVGVANLTAPMPTESTPLYTYHDIHYWIAVTPNDVTVPTRAHIRDADVLTEQEPSVQHTNWCVNPGSRVWILTTEPGLSIYVDAMIEPVGSGS